MASLSKFLMCLYYRHLSGRGIKPKLSLMRSTLIMCLTVKCLTKLKESAKKKKNPTQKQTKNPKKNSKLSCL